MSLQDILKEQLKEDVYEIESDSTPGFNWHVKKINGKLVCDCPGYKMHYMCKHVLKVLKNNGGI